jgi:hypothetical protein
VRVFLLFVFCGVVCCSVYVVIPVLPNRKAEIPEVSHKGGSEVCRGVFIVEVSEGVVLIVCFEPCRGDSTAE